MHMGDFIVQLFYFIFMIALIVGVILLLVSYRKRSSKLDRIEDKLDELLSDKEKRN